MRSVAGDHMPSRMLVDLAYDLLMSQKLANTEVCSA
jgi:hypothetical protein